MRFNFKVSIFKPLEIDLLPDGLHRATEVEFASFEQRSLLRFHPQTAHAKTAARATGRQVEAFGDLSRDFGYVSLRMNVDRMYAFILTEKKSTNSGWERYPQVMKMVVVVLHVLRIKINLRVAKFEVCLEIEPGTYCATLANL